MTIRELSKHDQYGCYGWYTYGVHGNCPVSKTPCPSYPSTSKILPASWPWTSNFKWTPSLPPILPAPLLQMITNQLKLRIIQGLLLYVIRSFFQVGFRFQYQLINIVWTSFDFFPFSWILTIYFFMTLYSCLCSCCPKLSQHIFLLWLLTFLVLILQSTCFNCTIWERKQTMKQQQTSQFARFAHREILMIIMFRIPLF